MAFSTSQKEKIYSPKHFAMSLGRVASTQYLTGLTVPYTTLFLTTMVGIPAAVYGTINTVNTIIGVLLIPIVAFLLQRLKLPWGKARSFMYISGLIGCIFIVLLFTDVGMANGMAKYIVYGVFLVCMHSFYNPASAACYVLFANMAESTDERADASAVQVQCANVYKVVMSAVMVPIVTTFAAVTGSEKLGYTGYAIVAAAIIYLFFVIFANAGRPYDPSDKDIRNGMVSKAPPIAAKQEGAKVPVVELVRSLFTVGPLSLISSKLLRDMANFCIGGMVAFYYTYVAQNLAMMGVYLSISAIVCMLGAFACPVINKFIGPKKTYLLGTALHGCAVLLAYFLGQNAYLFTALLCVVQFGYGLAGALETGLYADAVDYTILKRGTNTRPFLMTCLTVPGKVSSMASPAVLGFGLAFIGFDKTNVTEAAAAGIRGLLSGLPGILIVVAFVLFLLFPVTKEKLQALREEKARQ